MSQLPSLFDRAVLPTEPQEGVCYACNLPATKIPVNKEAIKEFKKMTGLYFPVNQLIGFPIYKDFKVLRIKTELPDLQNNEVRLCVGCSVEYMKRFNELNTLRKKNK